MARRKLAALAVVLGGVFLFAGQVWAASTHEYNYDYPPSYVGEIYNPTANAVEVGFYKPIAFTIDADGYYYSVANGDQKVQKFDSSGNILADWGGRGDGDGQFTSPQSIAVNSLGQVYITDTLHYNVQKFDSSGNFIGKWGSNGSADGQFIYPRGIAIDAFDNVYVVDANNHRIQKFDSDGNFLAKWGSYGSGDGQFNYPRGIDVGDDGNVYIADYVNHRIQKFDSDGNFLAKWGSNGSGDGQFNGPCAIAVNSLGETFVIDQTNYRVVKFDADNNFSLSWGSQGYEHGQFSIFASNGSIFVDGNDNVYVVDIFNNRVEVFDSDGVYLSQIGSSGFANGQFDGIGALLYDSSDNLYAVDIYNHRVQKFDSNGDFVMSIGSYGSGDGQMSYPAGLAIDASGYIYVAEQGNSRIQKFDSSGAYVTKWGSYGSGNGQFDNPVQINFDASGYLYVADSNNHRVQKFDSDGNYISSVGGYGSGDGQFEWVDGVDFDSLGNMYTSEYELCRVQKFDSDGNYLAQWGGCGSGDGQFREPVRVTIDPYDFVYVSEALNNRVQVFDTDGNFLAKWGTFGNGNGEFVYTRGVAINSAGRLAVGDMNNKIQFFEYTWGIFAPVPWNITPSSTEQLFPGEDVVFTVTTSMQRTNPKTSETNQMQVVLDTGIKVPLVYSSTNAQGDTVWTATYTTPEDMETGRHRYYVQANAALVKTTTVVSFASPATGTDNTGISADATFLLSPRGGIGHGQPAVITPPSIAIKTPTAGGSYKEGKTLNIEWVPAGSAFTGYAVSYSLDGGTSWTEIGEKTTSTSQNWTIPILSSANAEVKVDGYDNQGAFIASAISGLFTIVGTGEKTSSGSRRNYDPALEIENAPTMDADKGLVAVSSDLPPACVAGSLIKGSLPSVYYCGADGKRYVFTSAEAFFTWYTDFSSVKTISDEDLAKIPIGGNATYRPGAKLVKITTDPKVYAVSRGGILRWVTSEAVASELYGADWNRRIDDISDAFFVNYSIGEPIE